MLLPWEDRILATSTVILLHILALVDVAGSVALVAVAMVAVALVAVPLVAVPLVAIVVVALVVAAITTAEYTDRFIDGNRIIGAFRKQFIQGLLLVK